MKLGCCILALLIGFTHQIIAQDGVALRDLQVNTKLIDTKKTILISPSKSTKPLLLPFFEDFSSLHSPFPNDSLWQDNMVFINVNFPLFPPTIGVATFDALDANGRLYEQASVYSFPADTLTSRPIRMDSIFSPIPQQLTPGDSVYFSFYYQPGGGFGDTWESTVRGRAPARNDEFILEFRGDTGRWDQVWSANGQTLKEFCPQCPVDTVPDQEKTFFKQVMISVAKMMDSLGQNYFYDGFQFRFRNISSLDPRGSAAGQWHLDYIRLAPFRNVNDVFSDDIAFVDRAQRVLKDFQAMPIKQFQPTTDLVNRIPLVYRNLYNELITADYRYRIFNQAGEIVWQSTVATPNIEPFYTHGFNASDIDFTPQLVYNFSGITNPQTFTIQHILEPTGERQDVCPTNDTMEHFVHFGNFYAYDDGTPEMGFGFEGDNVRTGQFAYHFPLRVLDTLVAIQVWFNPTLDDMSRAFFNLAVWDAKNDSTPSDTPRYTGERLTAPNNDIVGYQTYALSEPVILQQGSFFIGFQQQSDAFLNIGFDQNNNAENRMFYRTIRQNEWYPVLYYGAAMIRPIFGTSTPTGFCEKDMTMENINVYPNPSDGTIFVESSENVVNIYEIYDLNGKRLSHRTIRSTQFSITLPEQSGIYILLLHTEKGLVSKKVVRR